jgi:sugar transferase EpsL
MKSAWTFLRALPDRGLALALLIILLPLLIIIGFLLRTNSDEPILLREEVQRPDGTTGGRYRFRTTGRGSAAFRAVGRYLRRYSVDEFPALWSIVTGDLRLRDLLRLCDIK